MEKTPFRLHETVSTEPDPDLKPPVIGEVVGIQGEMVKVVYHFARWVPASTVRLVAPPPGTKTQRQLESYIGKYVDIVDENGEGMSGLIESVKVEQPLPLYILVTDEGFGWVVRSSTTISTTEALERESEDTHGQ